MAPKQVIEVWGDLLVGNLWISHVKAVLPDQVVILTKGDWWDIYYNNEAARIIDELIKPLLRGAMPPLWRGKVAWRVTEVV